MTSRTILTACLITLALTWGAAAQTPTLRVSGQVERLDGATLMVKTIDGTELAVTLPADVLVTALVNRALSDIKQGDFVGSAAVPGGDGKLRAQEVHIFPESLRGMGEGHRPMSGPNRSMTNAVVAEVAVAPDGRDLRLKYKGGEQVIEVTPDARIVAIVRSDRSILVPGSAVFLLATRQADGALTATMVQGEKDGVKPLS